MIDKTEQEIMNHWIERDNPVVTVCSTTYNHENYLEQALDSFLMQETTFSFEIIIRDDCSTDETINIMKKYVKKFPNIIKPIYEKENQYSLGRKMGIIPILQQASGKYIALCEGDDFWISSKKLQKQVDLIESDETFKAVYSQVKWVDKDNKELGFSDNKIGILDYKKLLQVNPVHTCAFLIDRSIITNSVMEILKKAPYGDYVLFLAASSHGNIAFIDEALAAYRRDVGVMHQWSASESGLNRLKIFDLFEEHNEFNRMSFHMNIAKQYLCIHVSRHLSDEKDYGKSMKYFLLGLYYTGYVLFAKKEEMYRKVGASEIIKTGIFSIPYIKVIYRKLKGVS